MSPQPAPSDPNSPTAFEANGPAAAATPATASELGQLREYVLLEKIAQGGMGAVYRAVHKRLDKIVALKTLPTERMSNPNAVARFTREMKAIGKLNHPNIVQATDAGEVDGIHFLVMEYVEGTDLARAARQVSALPVATACEIARQAALGLAHAHEQGLIHRDVKPSNLLLSTAGQVKLLDLGLALLQGRFSDEGGQTVTGMVMGTFDYMAPEQAENAHAVTARADVYSLGCTLYHLLTGRAPFAAHATSALKLRAHAAEAVPGLCAARPEVPLALEAIVLRMLAKNPVDRFAGAAEVVMALAPFAAGADLPGIAATLNGAQNPPQKNSFSRTANAETPSRSTTLPLSSPQTRPPRAVGRRRWLGMTLAVVVLLVLGGLVGVLVRFWPPRNDGQLTAPAKDDPEALAAITFPRPAPASPGEVRLFEGHSHQVNAVAVTRDGRLVVSGGNDAALIIWDAATGKELRRAEGFAEIVWAVAVAPDGRQALAGGGGAFDKGELVPGKDFDLHLIDLATGREVRRLTGHTDRIDAVAYAPVGHRAISGSSDGTLRVWDTATGTEVHKLTGHAGVVCSVAVSPDGKQAISGGVDGTVRLWNLEIGREIRRFNGNASAVISVALSPDGRQALSGGLDRSLRLWDVGAGREERRFPDHPTAVTAVAFTRDGRRILSGSGSLPGTEGWIPAGYDSAVRLWDVATARELIRYDGHTSSLTCVCATPDGYHALSGASDNQIRLWRLPEPLPVVPFTEDEAQRLQQRWATLSDAPMTLTNTLGMELRLIPPGEFAFDENSRAQVTRAFYLGRYEVTIGQFRKFVEETHYKTEAEKSAEGGSVELPDGTRIKRKEFTWRHKDVAQGDDYPVGQMAWNDAAKFCEWLSRKEKKTYRLPTEAEWEWACRAGTATPHSCPNGDLLKHAWLNDNSGRRSQPVGRLQPNPWGLFDLYGNQAEFCGDWADAYPAGTTADPSGAAEGEFRVLRGGAHIDDEADSTIRYTATPTFCMAQFGFRVVCELAAPKREDSRHTTLIDADVKTYAGWLLRMRQEGFRPVYVQARDAGGSPRFQAVAVRDSKPIAWEAPFALDPDDDERRFKELGPLNYRNLCSCGYIENGQVLFASLYAREEAPPHYFSFSQLSANDMTAKVAEMKDMGYAALSVQGYTDGQKTLFACTFQEMKGQAWLVQLAVAPPTLDKVIATQRKNGLRPVSLGAHVGANGPRLSIAWLADKPAILWEFQHSLSAADYRAQEDFWSSRGYRPLSVVAYDRAGKTEYAAIWVRDNFGDPPRPRSGRFVPELEPFDRAVTQFMAERSIPAAALAVVKDGRIVLSRGYGYMDRKQEHPVPADASFRLASLTKMITAAAIKKLIRDGKLQRSDKIFDLLALAPPPGKTLDQRWKKVTIGELLNHKGGWDTKAAGFDPMFESQRISEALGKPGPATPADIIQYMSGEPLQFEPGKKEEYSNFGYCLLGRAIEKVTGKSYIDFLRTDVLEPAGIKGVALGRTLPADRDPREPFYSDPARVPNVMKPKPTEKVPDPDGGFYLEALDSHGGLRASATDVARFLMAFDLEGEPIRRDVKSGANFGSLPGTHTMALVRPDGVKIVVLFNQRTDPSGLDYFKIEEVMNLAAAAVKRWPGEEP